MVKDYDHEDDDEDDNLYTQITRINASRKHGNMTQVLILFKKILACTVNTTDTS